MVSFHKLPSLLLLGFLALTEGKKKDWKFPKFVIVNFDVKYVGSNRVEFHAGRKAGEPSILTKLEFSGRRTLFRRFPIYEATVVQKDDVNAKLAVGVVPTAVYSKKALIYMHGFNVFPSYVFTKCAEYEESSGRLVIPLIWKSENSGVLGYCADRKVNSEGAAEAFRPLLDLTKGIRKSLLCHSMGNYVLRLAARASAPDEEPFEDIFMVAADVHRNIFDQESNMHTDDPLKNDGLEILSMAKRQVHVLYSPRDIAMWVRPVQPCTPGQVGLGFKGYREGLLHEDIRDSDKLAPAFSCQHFSHLEDWKNHGYQFAQPAIDYYEGVMNSTWF